MMQLKANQTYLKSKEQYELVCRLAQVRVERKALTVEEDRIVAELRAMMFDAQELVDVQFVGQQQRAGSTQEELDQMWVARISEDGHRLDVHPAYVSDRFRPGNTAPDEPLVEPRQLNLFDTTEKGCPATQDEPQEGGNLPEKEEEEKRSKKEKEEKESTPIATLPTRPSAAAAAPAAGKTESVPAGKEVIYVDRFIRFWNRLMEGRRIPKIESLRGRRLELLRARTVEYGGTTIIEVLRQAAASTFLNGGGSQGWRASIDWILKPDNFLKVKEGLYDDRELTAQQQAMQQAKQQAQQLREVNRAIGQQISEELHQRIEQQQRRAATPVEIVAILGDRACPEIIEAARQQIAANEN